MVEQGRRFFIAGCQRSGTTLLRLTLECHPAIYVHDELAAYKVLAGATMAIPPTTPLVGFKIPRWTECLGDELAWDEGIPEQVQHLYRGEPIIFIFRDVRDTIASMRKLRMTAEQSWLQFCAQPILQAKFERTPLGLRFAKEWDIIQQNPDREVLIGALYWKYKNAVMLDYLDRGWPVLPICYETLVEKPEPQLRRICHFLNIHWDERLLQHPHMEHTEVFENGTVMGNTDPKRAIDRQSVEQWREWLSVEEEAAVMDLVGDLPQALAQRARGRQKWWQRLREVLRVG